jgi:DeoR/GlpR family transcriptional regulator of sugar metabolism
MRIRERRAFILKTLESQGEVSVGDVSRHAGVSEVTVRRDLEALARMGALVRGHGRAIIPVSRSHEPPFDVRVESEPAAKQRIGVLCAGLVAEGETIVLDVGTTALQVALALRDRRNITVLTPSLPVADVLVEAPGVRLMLTGGFVRPGERSLVGDTAVACFRDFRFDTVVLGVAGIDVGTGLTDYNLDQVRVKRAALEIARRVIVVADASKLGRVVFARICPLSQVNVLVTDASAPADLVASFRDSGVEVQLA